MTELFQCTNKGVTAVVTRAGYEALTNQSTLANHLRDQGIPDAQAWADARKTYPTPPIATFVADKESVERVGGHHVGTLDLLKSLVWMGNRVMRTASFGVPNSNGVWDIPHVTDAELTELFGFTGPTLVHDGDLARAKMTRAARFV